MSKDVDARHKAGDDGLAGKPHSLGCILSQARRAEQRYKENYLNGVEP
jgi:hypothetical protein